MSNISRLLNLSSGGSETEQYVAITVGGSGFTNGTHTTAVFPWSKSEGWGTQLNTSTSIYPNRADSIWSQIAWSPNKGALASTHFDSPLATAVAWDAGYGTKYTNPSTAIGGSSAQGIAFHPNGNYLAVGSNSTPYLQVYDWSDSTGWGSRRSNSWNPNSLVNYLTWHPDGGWLIAITQNSQRWHAVKWTGSSLTTRYETPDSFYPQGTAYKTSFNNAGTYIAVGAYHASDDRYRLIIREFNASSSGNPFGTVATVNIPSSVAVGVFDVKWTPDDSAIVLCSTTAPYLHAYEWSNSTGLGNLYTALSTNAPYYPDSLAFNTDGDVLFAATRNTAMLEAYEFNSSTGWGSKYTSPTLSGYSSTSDAFGLAYLDMG